MAIRYTKVKRKMNFGKRKGETLYGASILREGIIDQERLAQFIQDTTTLSKTEAIAMLRALGRIIQDHICDSMSVKLDIGTFTPTISAKAVKEAEDVDNDTIKNISVRFRPSVELTDALKETKLKFDDLNKRKVII